MTSPTIVKKATLTDKDGKPLETTFVEFEITAELIKDKLTTQKFRLRSNDNGEITITLPTKMSEAFDNLNFDGLTPTTDETPIKVVNK